MTIPASENVQPDETDRVPISQKQSDSCREVIEPLPESERAGHEPSRLTMSATPLSSWLKNSTGAEAFAEKPDFASAIKALEAIAHEKQTETLLAQLLKIMMECAGAERSLLILESAGEAFIHATASPGRTEIYLHDPVPLAQADNVPTSIVN